MLCNLLGVAGRGFCATLISRSGGRVLLYFWISLILFLRQYRSSVLDGSGNRREWVFKGSSALVILGVAAFPILFVSLF